MNTAKNIVKSWKKAASQYLYLIATLLVQLASVLMLPRLIGIDNYAVIAYAQAFAIWISLFIEYGFSFSATRSIAKSPERLIWLTNRVRSANYFLAFLMLLVSPIIAFQLPLLSPHPDIIALSLALALAQGLTPWWYFQGRQQVYRLVFWEFGAAILTVISWYIVIKMGASISALLWVQLAFRVVVMCVGQFIVMRDVAFISIDFFAVFDELKKGLSLFVFMFSSAIYTVLNILILGFFSSHHNVAIFAVAEKIMRLAVRFWEPLNRFFYPKIVNLMHQSSLNKKKLIKRLFWGYFFISIVISVILFFLKDYLVSLVLGESYEEAVAVFCILILAIPLIAISNVLGILYLLPSGRDRIFNAIIISGGTLHLLVAIILIQYYGVLGMALSVVITEGIVAIAMLAVVSHIESSSMAN